MGTGVIVEGNVARKSTRDFLRKSRPIKKIDTFILQGAIKSLNMGIVVWFSNATVTVINMFGFYLRNEPATKF